MPVQDTNTRDSQDSLSPAESIARLNVSELGDSDLRRRITYLIAFRVLVITIVLGATTLLHWLGDVDLTKPNSLFLYGIIASTYVLTLVYIRYIEQSEVLPTLLSVQIVADLVIASLLVHITGGAQSAYTFFFPLAVIASTILRSRKWTLIVALTAAALFLFVSYTGWLGIIPTPSGQIHMPVKLTALDFGRAVALNLAAIVGIGVMSIQLATQLQKSSSDLEDHRLATADLLTVHKDIVDCLTSGLITVDAQGTILTINKAASDILSCDISTSVGTRLAEQSQSLATFLETLPFTGRARRGEVQTSDKAQVLGVSISPLLDHRSQSVGRIVNFQDLTEVKRLEQQIKRTERLTVIGTLAAGIAHEIRNPLASISGSIELLATAPSTDDDNQALMSIVTREIDRLNSLITELLEYANPRPAKFASFDLAEVIKNTIQVFAQSPEFKEVEVSLEQPSEGSFLIQADPEKLQQLVWNLLRNGAQASLVGKKHVWVSLAKKNSQIELRFRNDGPAIPEETLSHIFDPFFTTKAKGTGLGLAIVHSTVIDHGGTISVESNASETQFSVCLPCKHTEKTAAASV